MVTAGRPVDDAVVSEPIDDAGLARPRQFIPLLLCAAALGYFVVYFQDAPWQPTVDLAWAAAVALWMIGWWSARGSSAPRVSVPYWFCALYVAAMVPFAHDWRWAMTGDSMGWATAGIQLAEHGPTKSLLSLHGVAQFGYGQQAVHNLFMVLLKPTLFWHRFGQIMVGAASLLAIAVAYGRLVTPNFGLLVAACAMSTSVMIVHTMCSYPLVDALAGENAVLAAALWVRQDPTSRRAWLVLGLFTGLLTHFTPNGISMGLCV